MTTDPRDDLDPYNGLPFDEVLGEDGRPVAGPSIADVLALPASQE